MKVLIIQTNAIDKNGVTNVVFNYLKALSVNDLCIDMVSKNDPIQVYKDEVSRHHGTIFYFPRTYKSYLKRLFAIRRLVKRNKYDIVHFHCNSHIIVPELLAIKAGGCKVRIVHSHNTSTSFPFVSNLLTPLFNSLCTHCLACGIEAGRWMFGKREFEVMNNGIDTKRFAFSNEKRTLMRNRLGLSDSDILIGHVGHYLGVVKNQKFIVNIFNKLSEDAQYRLCLIGDGPNKPEVERKVDELGLKDRVYFAGNVDNVEDYLNAIDIIVMPSLHEGLPLTLVEQQANGLICLCADTITQEADKTGNLRFLSLQASIDEWAEAVKKNININEREFRSVESIKRIRTAGYDIYNEAKKLMKFYQRCIEGKSEKFKR